VYQERLHFLALVGAAGGALPLHPFLTSTVAESHLSAQVFFKVLKGQVAKKTNNLEPKINF
jgi:hypothetical protein